MQSVVTPMLPSGWRMVEDNIPAAVQEQIRYIAAQLLQRLLGPLIYRYRGRQARIALIEAMRSKYSPVKIKQSVSLAMEHISHLGRLLHETESRATENLESTGTDSLGSTLRPSTVAAAEAMSALRSTLADVFSSSLMTVRVHVQDEKLQWVREPSHEVLVLVAGSVERHGPVIAASPGTRRSSFRTSRLGSASSPVGQSSRRVSLASGVIGAVPRPPMDQARRSSLGMERGSTLPSPVASRSGVAVEQQCDILHAPQVFGELSCIGSFPYCMDLVVTSSSAIVVAIPKHVYCCMVSEVAHPDAQRQLLLEALLLRERYLPIFAPMTLARLKLCPLLAQLRMEHLHHIRDLMIPRVYAAGMGCGETGFPEHIFFVHRGVVRMERDGAPSTAPSQVSQVFSMPKNRPLLFSGHTYGETSCIFGQSVGSESYFAITHVDMYLLPFSVLIQLMKQEPAVQNFIYHGAKELSLVREREYHGVLYGPVLRGTVLREIHGIIPLNSPLLAAALATPSPVQQLRQPSFQRDSVKIAQPPSGDRPSSAQRRRVTISDELRVGYADGSSAIELSPLPIYRAFPDQLTSVSQIPLVNVLPSVTNEFLQVIERQWQCHSYSKGDIIVTKGEECNRVLFFTEGRAGIVMSEQRLSKERRPGLFGPIDIANVSPAALQPIPLGHMVGYTCVRRHRWTRAIIAMDDTVEVWELKRPLFVHALRTKGLDREMNSAVLQLLQPLAVEKNRLFALDYQPLLTPMPSSLWQEQAVPNLHPVVITNDSQCLFPIWTEGDFPMDRRASSQGGDSHMATPRYEALIGGNSLMTSPMQALDYGRGDLPSDRRPSSASTERGESVMARSQFIAKLATNSF